LKGEEKKQTQTTTQNTRSKEEVKWKSRHTVKALTRIFLNDAGVVLAQVFITQSAQAKEFALHTHKCQVLIYQL